MTQETQKTLRGFKMNQEDINGIAKKLQEADRVYHNTGNSIMEDQEYDSLQALLKANDPSHPYFEKVGDKPSSLWEKATHDIPMGSLEKVHSEEEFIKWAEKFPDETFIIQPKVDGLSLSQKYENKVFSHAITRGDGQEGELISPNVEKMTGFIRVSNQLESSVSVRCEIVLPKADLDRINSISGDDPYKNCRNAASGISRRLDGKFCKYLSLYYYDILTENPMNEDEKIKFLKESGFNAVPYSLGNIEKMVKFYNKIRDNRGNLPYGVDGVVVKINFWKKQQELGVVNNRPKGQIAWKFDPPSAATYLRSVSWELGRTGVITPLGHVDKVEIEGSEIEKVTLHNLAQLKKLGLGLNDLISMTKAGDVIPHVESVIEHKNIPIEIPTHCPSCGTLLCNDGIHLMCLGESCHGKHFQTILNFIKVVKIDSFGESLAEKLCEQGKLKNLADIFILKKEDIAGLEGWGDKSANTIIENINKIRKMNPAIFLASLGIPSLSTSTAEDLWKKYADITKVRAASVEDICTIKGYSDISATKIVEGLLKFGEQINLLLKHVELQEASSAGGKLSGMSFCFTGAMEQPRAFYQAIVTKHGGKNDSTVTKTTTYLVCNENKGSSKSRKAEQYGCKIISTAQFLELTEENIQNKPKIVTESLFEGE